MFRRSGSSLLGSLHRAVAAQRQATGSARDVVAAVSALPLPEKLREREKDKKAASASSATAQQPALDSVPLQLAPYQALPVDGRITRHFTRGLPVVDPASRTAEDREQAVDAIITAYTARLRERTRHHLGYPYNLDFDFGPLEGLLKYSINNLGDPFIESNYGVHSREFEIGVLQWFARLWEIDDEDYWGYITNCGTEGNLHGILVGREVLPDGILYASKESHYSVFKAARMYRMDAVSVGTLPTGEIDYDELQRTLIANRGRPAVLNVNVGTTVKGAVDDVDRILHVLQQAGYSEDKFFIHCDGALFGLMLPFVRDARRVTTAATSGNDAPAGTSYGDGVITFRKPIGSVSVSGHKFVGVPMPCGVVMTRKRHVMKLSSDIEYLNSRDATIMGSRNGHAPIFMWHTLTRKGYEGLRADVEGCIDNARAMKTMLEKAGVPVMLNELSSTVVFERPVEEAFVKKWQLACEGDIAHVVVMPNVTLATLREFTNELTMSRALYGGWRQVQEAKSAATKTAVSA